jgi:hypothetical protein
VDQVYYWLGQGLYWGLIGAFWVSSVVLLGYLLWNKQWLFAVLTVGFTAAFYPTGPLIVLGPLIALVVGWQEADKWKIKNLLRVNSALLVICFLLMSRDAYNEFTKPKPKIDPAKLARERAAKAQKAAGLPKAK